MNKDDNNRKNGKGHHSSNFVKKLPTFKIKSGEELYDGYKIFSADDISIFITQQNDDEYFILSLAKLIKDEYIEFENTLIDLHGSDLKLIIDRINSVFFHWKIEQKRKNKKEEY
jgi:hypothetical protein